MTEPLPASPRLVALQAALAAGDRAALDRFWAEVEARGTPRVESLERDEARALVTLLWRDGTPGAALAARSLAALESPRVREASRETGAHVRWRVPLRGCGGGARRRAGPARSTPASRAASG